MPNVITVGSREVLYRFRLLEELHTKRCKNYAYILVPFDCVDLEALFFFCAGIVLSLISPPDLEINSLDDGQQCDLIRFPHFPSDVRNLKISIGQVLHIIKNILFPPQENDFCK